MNIVMKPQSLVSYPDFWYSSPAIKGPAARFFSRSCFIFEKTATVEMAELAEMPGMRGSSEKNGATSCQDICGKKPSPVDLYQVRVSLEVLRPLDPRASRLY